MLAQLATASALPASINAAHLLVLLPKGKTLPTGLSQRDLLAGSMHVALGMRYSGGLGSVAGEVAGFGAGWALRMLQGK